MPSLSNDQSGIVLTFASSLACVLGSLVIYSDVIWRWLVPSTKFNLNNNENFLVCSLSLSSGVLLFTSLYKLLPEGLVYFKNSTQLKDSPRLAQLTVILAYFAGIIICASINAIIHSLTSQSVVHCVHDSAPGHHHNHDEYEQQEAHGHSHANLFGSYGGMGETSVKDTKSTKPKDIEQQQEINSKDVINPQSEASSNGNTITDETTPLVDSEDPTPPRTITDPCPLTRSQSYQAAVSRSQSFIDLTQWTIRKKKSIGKCLGYSSVDCCEDCCNKTDTSDLKDVYDYVDPHTGTHRNDRLSQAGSIYSSYRNNPYGSRNHSPVVGAARSTTSVNQIIPEEDDIDFSPTDQHEHYHHQQNSNDVDISDQYDNNNNNNGDNADLESNLSAEYHHHHVSTRYSHLFSIGLQTAFAISVHKIPEGILTFATSHANKDLGFSVFVALAIHNFSEGFTIAFPLFLALKSRGIAFLAAFVLGGLSQPFGALIAWIFFHYHPSDGNDNGTTSKPDFVFGMIVSVTAGFLSIIGLQMYGTAISFGGQQRLTMLCAFAGIAFIGLGYSLTAK